ncbi:MAG: uroporphyrinogen decarboxylase family protein [Candidatus Omnitrophota bacterium]
MNLTEAIDTVLDTLRKRPEKNLFNIWADLEKGNRPRYCPLTIGRQADPEDPIEKPPEGSEEKLVFQIAGILKPLQLENPTAPCLSLDIGEGTGFMPAGFGIKISPNPSYPGGVEKHLTIEEIEKIKVPEPEKEERFKKLKEKIDFYLEYTPEDFKIGLPDMQGPFNIAHSILGSEIFFLMKDKPEKVHFLMNLVTDYYIKCYQLFKNWIPESRWVPWIGSTKRIAECSSNLISKDLYKEFVAPYDRKLTDFWKGEIAIHTCSGSHVFEVTLEELPGVRYTECGIIPCACAGFLTVEQAISRIKGKPIILSVGEELILGKEEETIKDHFKYLKEHPLMIFGYNGMYWKKKDDESIKNLHQTLDDYYYKIFISIRQDGRVYV